MKKITVFLAAAILAAAFAGCGGDDKKDGLNGPGTPSSSSIASSESASGPESAAGSSADGSDAGDTVSVIIKDAQLKAAYTAVREEFGEFWLAMPAAVTEAQMTEIYYIDPADIEEFTGEMSMVNVSGDTFIGVKAKPGRAEAVAEALGKRRQDIITQFETYPVNFMDVKSQAAKVITEGDYVFLVLMGELNVPDGEDATLEMAEAEVARAENAIRSAFVG